MSSEKQKQQQREAMEKQRFGMTRKEILDQKGYVCVHCGKVVDLNGENAAVIDHIHGGGRHYTENGLLPPQAHDINNFQVLCKSCAGMKDRADFLAGHGHQGNPNNPSQ